jgi:hypothetical protein
MPGPGKVEDFDWIIRVEVFEFVNKLTHGLINSGRQWTLVDSVRQEKTDPNAYALKSNASPMAKKDEGLIRVETSLIGQASVSIQPMGSLTKNCCCCNWPVYAIIQKP